MRWELPSCLHEGGAQNLPSDCTLMTIVQHHRKTGGNKTKHLNRLGCILPMNWQLPKLFYMAFIFFVQNILTPHPKILVYSPILNLYYLAMISWGITVKSLFHLSQMLGTGKNDEKATSTVINMNNMILENW